MDRANRKSMECMRLLLTKTLLLTKLSGERKTLSREMHHAFPSTCSLPIGHWDINYRKIIGIYRRFSDKLPGGVLQFNSDKFIGIYRS